MTLKQIIARIGSLFRARRAERPAPAPDGTPGPSPDSPGELTLTTPLEIGTRPPGIYRDDLLFVRAPGYRTIREAGGRPVAYLLSPDALVERVPGLASDTGQPARDVATKVLDALPVFDVVDDVDPSVLTAALDHDDIRAAPVHAVGMAGHWRYFPADEGFPLAESPITSIGGDTGSPTRRTVAVIDTGVIDVSGDQSGAHTALLSGVSPLRPVDVESGMVPDALRGHAMFVSSLIRQVDPSLDVLVAALEPANLAWCGDDARDVPECALTDELQLLVAVILMTDRLIGDGTETVALNLSLGAMVLPDGESGHHHDDHDHDHDHDDGGHDHGGGGEHEHAPQLPATGVDVDMLGLGIRAAVDYWKAAPWPGGQVPPIIAAAGNHDEDGAIPPPTPLVPAAYSDVWAVVATDGSGEEKAPFTYLGWPGDTKCVRAPGISVVGCRGLDANMDPSADIAWAWSGTSFAAALVSAAVATTGTPQDFDYTRVSPKEVVVGNGSRTVTVID